MNLEQIIDALRAVRDVDTNHRGLQALRRQLLRFRPAADQLFAELLAASPNLQELHAIWEVQVSAKDLLVSLELCSLCTTLLRYRPSPRCSSQQRQQISQAQDQFAASLLQRRLKAVYFHLSSGNRARSNAAFALLTAISNRGGSVLRELLSSFDFSLSVLPKLARPPKAPTAEASPGSSAGAAAGGLAEQPAHWQAWNTPQMSKRPSRAMFVGWVAAMLQSADPLLLPVLLRTRVLMSGLLHHLSTDPPGIIIGVLGLLESRVLGQSNRVGPSVQLDLWTDSALQQLATICTAAEAGEEGAAGATEEDRSGPTAAAVAAAGSHGNGVGNPAAKGSDSSSTDSGGDDSDGSDDDDGSEGDVKGASSSDDDIHEGTTTTAQGDGVHKQNRQRQGTRPLGTSQAAAEDAAAAAAAAQRVADAAAAAHSLLLLLLTSPSQGLLAASTAARSPAAAFTPQEAPAPATYHAAGSSSTIGSSSSSVGARRALRLLQWLQPGHHATHAHLLQAVGAAQPWLSAELLQGLSYQLEPKPCGAWLGSVAVTGQLIGAAVKAPCAVKQQVAQAQLCLQACSSSSSSSSVGAAGSWQSLLAVPDAEDLAVKAAVRCCVPPAMTKGGLSRGLQHQTPLVLAGTLSLLQQAAAALQQLLAPIESLAAAAAAAAGAAAAGAAVAASQAGPQPEPQEQLLQSAASRLLLQRSMQLQQDYNTLLQQQQQQQQQHQCEESHATGLTHKAVLLQAAAQGWCAFLHGLRQSMRRRLPEVSVLVALVTNLQRAAVAAGVGTSAAAAAKPKGAAANEQQQPQQPPQQQWDQEQAEWLLVQANSVLCAYARWLPEAIADGHVDLGKLLLQGQGQDLLTAPPEVQRSALRVLAAADKAAAAAASTDAAAIILQATAAPAAQPAGTSSSGSGSGGLLACYSLPALPVSLLLPLLRVAAASPSEPARHLALQMLSVRLSPYCSTHNSEAALWLQHLPQLWCLGGAAAPEGVVDAVLSKEPRGQGLEAAAAAPLPSCVDGAWLAAHVAVLGFIAEALAAVERRPQEPWELIQAALIPTQQANTATTNTAGGAEGACSFAAAAESLSSIQPSLFAVCAFRRLLRLLKSNKASAAVKAAVCSYVCSVWQQLLQQQLDQSAAVAVLVHLLQEECSEWCEGGPQQTPTAAAAAVGASQQTAEEPAGKDGSAHSSKRQKKKRQLMQEEGPQHAAAESVGGNGAAAAANGLQQQQQCRTLLLPPEACCIVSLYQRAVQLQQAAGSCLQFSSTLPGTAAAPSAPPSAAPAPGPGPGLTCLQPSPADGTKRSSKKRKQSDRATATLEPGPQPNLQSAAALPKHLLPRLQLRLASTDMPSMQQQVQQQLQVAAAAAAAPAGTPAKTKKRHGSEAAAAAADTKNRASKAWQQLQLLLLSCPAVDAVAAAAAAVDLLITQQQQQQQVGTDGQLQESHVAAAAIPCLKIDLRLLLSVLAAHGLCWAHIAAAAAGSNGWDAAAVAHLLAESTSRSAAPAGTQQQQQQQQQQMVHVSLAFQSCWDCTPTAGAAAAAAAAEGDLPAAAPATPWRVVQEPSWRFGQLLQLQQLSRQEKLQLVEPACCGLVRLAAAAAAGYLKRKHAELLLAYGVQLLQALMCSPKQDNSSSSSSTASSNKDSSSNPDGAVLVDAEVLQAALQHSMLLKLFADGCPAAAAAGSKQLSKHIVLLLVWLLQRSVAGSLTASTAPTEAAVVSACMPFIHKALTQLQQDLAGSGSACAGPASSTAQAHAAAVRGLLGSQEPSLAAATSLQLLQELSSSSSRRGGCSVSLDSGLLEALQQVASSLLAAITAASAETPASRSSKKRKQQPLQGTALAAAGDAAPVQLVWQRELLLAVARVLLSQHQQQQQQQPYTEGSSQQWVASCQSTATAISPAAAAALPDALLRHLLDAFVQRQNSQVDEFLASAVAAGAQQCPLDLLSHTPGNAAGPISAAASAAVPAAAAAGGGGAFGIFKPSLVLSLSDAVQVLPAALQYPLTPAQVAVAAQLLQQSFEDPTSQQQLHQVFPEAVQQCIAAAAAGSAGRTLDPAASSAAAGARREALALLLPAAAAYLSAAAGPTGPAVGKVKARSLLDPSSPTAAPSPHQSKEDAVVCVFRPALLAFIQLKPKQQDHHQQLDSGESSLSQAAADCLQAYAVPVLQRCLQQQPLDAPDLSKLLRRLLPGKGYPVGLGRPDSKAPSAAAAAAAPALQAAVAGDATSSRSNNPQPHQQLQLATWLLQQQAGRASAATGKAADTTQQQEQLLVEVAAFVSCACSTLCMLHKQHPLKQEQTAATSQQQPSFELELLQQLDGWAGDVLAQLPDDLRIAGPACADGAAPGAAAFASVIAAVQQLALSVLKHRFGDSSSMRCVRRLLAALLPGGSGPGQQQLDEQQEEEDDAAMADEGSGGDALDGPGAAAAAGANEAALQAPKTGSSGSSSSSMDSSSGSDLSDDTSDDDDEQQQQQQVEDSSDSMDVDETSEPEEHPPSSKRAGTSSSGSGSGSSTTSGDTSTSTADSDESESSQELPSGLLSRDSEMQQPQDQDGHTEAAADDDGPDPSDPAARLYNPAAAAAAQGLLQLLVSHSGFVPALLSAQQPQQQGRQLLPAAVVAVPIPLSSYMAVVEAVWSCEGASAAAIAAAGTGNTGTSHSSSSRSGCDTTSGKECFKQQLVLLLEVLFDMCKLFTAHEQQLGAGTASAVQVDAAAGSSGIGLDPQMLQSLLQLLQVAYGGTLSDADRAILRVLLQLDALVPLQEHQHGTSTAGGLVGANGSDNQQLARSGPGSGGDDEGQAGPGSQHSERQQQQYPLPWPRCLFGQAAKLYYEQQHKQQQQAVGGRDGASTLPVSAAPAAAPPSTVPVDFVRQLLLEFAPLEPLQCALTVVLFPDRRCLNPDEEPGDELNHLYYGIGNTATGHGGSISSGGGAGGGNRDHGGAACVCAGAPVTAAAAAYDPVALLLLGLSVLQQGLLDLDSFAACGLSGVVLRALAAEDPALRSVAYACLDQLTAVLESSHDDPQPQSLGPPDSHSRAFGSIQQLLRSSKRMHQLRALLLWVHAGVTEPLQQLPTASAALAAEAALLLSAPGHPVAAVVRKLMVRQRALDTAGLPLFGRIMALSSGAGSSSGSAKGGRGIQESASAAAAAGGGGGSGLRGAAAVMAERQWLLQLLWMGLRVPGDGRLYRQKRVCETLMGLWGTSHSHMWAAAGTSHDVGLVLAGHSPDRSSSACGQQGLDGCIAQVLRQAVRLPGLARHLIRSAGLLPWLSGIAAQAGYAAAAAGRQLVAAGQPEDLLLPGDAAAEGPSWALQCLQQLLAGHVGLSHSRQQQEVNDVFAAYSQAVLYVLERRAGSGLSAGELLHLLELLVMLLTAAPSARARRTTQQQLQAGLWPQLSAAVHAECTAWATLPEGDSGVLAAVLHLHHQLATILS